MLCLLIPKSSFIQTLIRTFPTSFGSEHTGQEFSVRGFLPMLELNLAIVTAWCNEMIATARPNLVNALVSRCSPRFAMFKASDPSSRPLGSTDLQRVWNEEIPSAEMLLENGSQTDFGWEDSWGVLWRPTLAMGLSPFWRSLSGHGKVKFLCFRCHQGQGFSLVWILGSYSH